MSNDYESYCWFAYSTTEPNGKTTMVRELFPPLGRNDVYGGMTQTQIRTLAFQRLSTLNKSKVVQVEMID